LGVFSYFTYGLGIRSTLPLPELTAAEVGCDVDVNIAGDDRIPLEAVGKEQHIRIAPEEAIIALQGIGVFLIRGGREITVIPAPGADDSLLRLFILGTVMGVLLYQRGLPSWARPDGASLPLLPRCMRAGMPLSPMTWHR